MVRIKSNETLITIPSSAGTGSEVSKAAVISDPEHSFKKGGLSPLMFPHAAIGETKLIRGFPRNLNTATSLDAFVRFRTNPFSNQFALIDILRFIAPAIPLDQLATLKEIFDLKYK